MQVLDRHGSFHELGDDIVKEEEWFMKATLSTNFVKKSVILNLTKLRKLRRLLKTRNDSETIRVLMDKELALRSAQGANQELRNTGGIFNSGVSDMAKRFDDYLYGGKTK